ncbi:MAG TPA: glycosyltransferase family 39 protein [Acidobacteriota bacterium]|nr:glycosyltransferase family 39 protein [Acidobacteriota bacterium]
MNTAMKTVISERSVFVLLLILAAGFGFSVRLCGLSQIGLAEDEVNKILAVREYQRGVFSGNAEHPMLMKELILVSVTAADVWNRWSTGIPGAEPISEEVAIRLPNVLVGAMTVIPLYLLGSALFSRSVGILAAFFWATGIHAVFINRVAKEDTLLVFFLLWGLYFHRRMKTSLDFEIQKKRTFHLLSAACFGLMLASKYFPHFWGVSLLLFYLHRKWNPASYPPDWYGWRDLVLYLTVAVIVFIMANPMILHPTVWAHLFSYTGQTTVTHHGYMMFDYLFPNSIVLTPLGGTPWYFYLLALSIKLPPLVLLAFVSGVVLCLRRWRQSGPFFILFWLLFWLLPYSLVGVKFLRYMLSLMPAVYLAAAFAIVQLANKLSRWSSRSCPSLFVKKTFQTVLAGLLVFGSLSALISVLPFYSVYVNRLGGGLKHSVHYFPHDECYDLQLREAIANAVQKAPGGSIFAGETPAVFRYYLGKNKRPDVQVVNLSDTRFSVPASTPVYVFLQPGRIYYENRPFYTHLWNRPVDLMSASIEGKPVVQVYRIDTSDFMKIQEERNFVPLRSQKSEKQPFLSSHKEVI